MDQRLSEFISHARGKGMDHPTIRLLLLSAGWKEREIAAAMATEGLDLPVPQPPGAGGARDAFLYLLTFTALYVAIVGATCLYFEFLNHLFPDPAWPTYGEAQQEEARLPLAAVLIAFPLFLVLSVFLGRELAADPEKRDRPVRKWLTYLTLFLAASTIVGDLITLLYYFLEGELTQRLVLKGLALAAIAGTVLGHYLLALRPAAEVRTTLRYDRALAALAIVLAAGAVYEGFALAGSPFAARLRRLDAVREQDLRTISDQIINMSTKVDGGQRTLVQPLPESLEAVAEYRRAHETYDGRKLSLNDPETGVPYTYRVTGKTTFELCATFYRDRQSTLNVFWNHPAGEHCFKFDAEGPLGQAVYFGQAPATYVPASVGE